MFKDLFQVIIVLCHCDQSLEEEQGIYMRNIFSKLDCYIPLPEGVLKNILPIQILQDSLPNSYSTICIHIVSNCDACDKTMQCRILIERIPY